MYRRNSPCSSRNLRSSRGQRWARSSRTARRVRSGAPATSRLDWPPASARSAPGIRTVTATSDHRGPDAEHVWQVGGDLLPMFAFVGACVDLTGAGAEVDAGDVGVVGAHRITQHGRVERPL